MRLLFSVHVISNLNKGYLMRFNKSLSKMIKLIKPMSVFYMCGGFACAVLVSE